MGSFPDYNDDEGVNILDVIAAPEEAKAAILKIIAEGNYDPRKDYSNYLTEGVAEGGIREDSGNLEYQEISQAKLTANPLPSLPSISNVGATPFSGSISKSAVPGGFQPLPQVAGGRKKLYQLSQFHGGINQKSSPRDISDNECQEATNVTLSQIGKIKTLGTIADTTNGLSAATLASTNTDIPLSGYGLYIFKSSFSLASTPVQGDWTIVASSDGHDIVLKDSGDNTVTDFIFSNQDVENAPVYYAAGSGLYANDANLLHTEDRTAAILVNRSDINGTVDTLGWSYGKALLDSPDNGTGTSDVTMENGTLTDESDNGSASILINPNGSGNWGATGGVTYSFYVSYLFDNGCETGLSFLGTDVCTNEKLDFNVSLKHENANPFGGNKRIEGMRIYFREAGSVERYMLAEVSLPDGVKGALDSTYTPWNTADSGSNVYDLGSDASTPVNIVFESPPEIYTYVALNGYYANEVYDKSPDSPSVAPAPHHVRYRTATVGANGSVFIGCVMYRGKIKADSMMYSMPNKPGVFPELNVFDSPSSDGTPITVLSSFRDKILQFKQDALYVINISNPTQFYTEASFRNCGVMNPCQVFQAPFGVIFANVFGCYIYDGSKVISLTSGKYTDVNWNISEGSVVDASDADSSSNANDAINVPCVGYDPRSQSIIVLKDIGDDSTNTESWVYNIGTQSWSEGTSMITNVNNGTAGTGTRHSNFSISPNGYLSIIEADTEALKNYKLGGASTQSITYITKDLDFGLPSQTKKIFKVYVTYTSGSSNVPTATYGVDGAAPTTGFDGSSSTAFATGQTNAVAIFIPSGTAATGKKSFAFKINGTVDKEFEINDISILYRARPIK